MALLAKNNNQSNSCLFPFHATACCCSSLLYAILLAQARPTMQRILLVNVVHGCYLYLAFPLIGRRQVSLLPEDVCSSNKERSQKVCRRFPLASSPQAFPMTSAGTAATSKSRLVSCPVGSGHETKSKLSSSQHVASTTPQLPSSGMGTRHGPYIDHAR